ncbi:MAG: ATP-dependent Clp protease proteolytic subunit [Collinsella sp.]|nr:ATP-dependent Clp protease proteolytic subunit [Collinsella sp.]
MSRQPPSMTSPLIIRESSAGICHLSVHDEMLEHRELSVCGPIEDEMAFELCQHIRHLERRDPIAPVTVFISSPGGSVSAGLGIFDALRATPCPIHTIGFGLVASMGAIVYMAGDERELYPHAELMVHDPLIPNGPGGSALSLQETSRRLMGARRQLNTILATRSGLTLKRVQQLTAKDTYLDAERALELGFSTKMFASAKEG